MLPGPATSQLSRWCGVTPYRVPCLSFVTAPFVTRDPIWPAPVLGRSHRDPRASTGGICFSGTSTSGGRRKGRCRSPRAGEVESLHWKRHGMDEAEEHARSHAQQRLLKREIAPYRMGRTEELCVRGSLDRIGLPGGRFRAEAVAVRNLWIVRWSSRTTRPPLAILMDWLRGYCVRPWPRSVIGSCRAALV